MRNPIPQNLSVRITLTACLLAFGLGSSLPFFRRASVVPAPVNKSAIEISVASTQNADDLARGFAHFRIRNTGDKPVAILLGPNYPSMGMELPNEALDHSVAINYAFQLWQKKDFRTLGHLESVDATVSVLKFLNIHRNALTVGTFTGQVFYYGDVVNNYATFMNVSGHSDVGRVAGPLASFRVGWMGNSVLL